MLLLADAACVLTLLSEWCHRPDACRLGVVLLVPDSLSSVIGQFTRIRSECELLYDSMRCNTESYQNN
jgi:hypothetical protein